jgi:hypothetical protein
MISILIILNLFVSFANASSSAYGTKAETANASSSAVSNVDTSILFEEKIYPYVEQRCTACHGEGKGDIDGLAPNWIFNDKKKTEKQVKGYLRSNDIEKTKLFAQIKSQHWKKAEPLGAEKQYGENDVEKFKTEFAEYFAKINKSSSTNEIQNLVDANIVLKSKPAVGNDFSQLSISNPESQNTNKLKIKQVDTGGDNTCVLFESGKVKCWCEINYYIGEFGPVEEIPFVKFENDKVIQISTGMKHICALFENGKIKCWGENDMGKLGIGNNASIHQNERGSVFFVFANLGTERAVQVSAGANFTCALFEIGKVKCWGRNKEGQLGLGDSQSRGENPNNLGENLPYIDLGKDKVIQISAGASPCLRFI